ncbi:sulfatase-like hydrolase/transferase [Pelagicoccus mobilis]|uniref:Sulfatase-like hydrolase/transferase n=1 Tax=Pelagicoccus mobilis TaxID=415221 RepID=A0A934RWR1_9BACT|nr:sulfatase-like hydrolase/transferase [Pelagicoccus mobilis]MBK1875802.1 sulfatase-like hydrolase/transferase [Pelagicoccus mobilis]
MNLYRISRLAVLLMSLCGILGMSCSGKSTRPNILVILCDDLGYADVGFNGSKTIPTPALDELAMGGVICTSAYAAHPVCGPSRAALLTGRCPHSLGGQFNIPYFNHQWGVSTEEVFLSRILKESGYFTGAIGKWHLGEGHEYLPNQRGFDEFYGHLGGGHKYFPDKYLAEYDRRVKAGETQIPPNTTPHLRNGKQVRETEYLTDAFTREALSFIQEANERDQPFFLYLAYNAPHSPLEAKAEDLETFSHIEDRRTRTYSAMVHCVDYNVKRIVSALKENGAYEDTLIIFLSDNGGIPRNGASNAPLRGQKRDVEEGGFRVPMFWHWPKSLPAGRKFNHPVLTMDLYPTLANLAGANIPPGKILDGKDIWGALLQNRNPHHDELIAVVSHRLDYTDIAGRINEWKAVRSKNRWRLYRIDQDVGEQHDLSSRYPERLNLMIGELKQWASTHQMPKWVYSDQEREIWKENQQPWFEGTFDTN